MYPENPQTATPCHLIPGLEVRSSADHLIK